MPEAPAPPTTNEDPMPQSEFFSMNAQPRDGKLIQQVSAAGARRSRTHVEVWCTGHPSRYRHEMIWKPLPPERIALN